MPFPVNFWSTFVFIPLSKRHATDSPVLGRLFEGKAWFAGLSGRRHPPPLSYTPQGSHVSGEADGSFGAQEKSGTNPQARCWFRLRGARPFPPSTNLRRQLPGPSFTRAAQARPRTRRTSAEHTGISWGEPGRVPTVFACQLVWGQRRGNRQPSAAPKVGRWYGGGWTKCNIFFLLNK